MEYPEREKFNIDVHRALQNLYNPYELKRSPLLKVFGIDQRADAPSAIRKILISAIQSHKPDEKTPLESPAWRLYHVLSYRYSEQSPQKEVAVEMRLGIRQLRRLERQAVGVLTDALWREYKQKYISETAPENNLTELPEMDEENVMQGMFEVGSTSQSMPTSIQELDHLRESLPHDTVDVGVLLEAALRTISPLIEKLNIRVNLTLPENSLMVSGQMTTLKQSLIVFLTVAVHMVPGGQLLLELRKSCNDIWIQMRALSLDAQNTHTIPVEKETLELAVQLASMAGGSILMPEAPDVGSVFSATMSFPLPNQVSVLAIDDNADVLLLLNRYLLGTRYKFRSAQNYQDAMALIEECPPNMIILDVMLPGVDGWEILGRLREHPVTKDIPVLVCTILPQEGLALALGAAGFIRKPVRREDLLKALDQQTAVWM